MPTQRRAGTGSGGRARVCRLCACLWIAAAAAGVPAAVAFRQSEPAWELKPYHVRLLVITPGGPSWTKGRQRRLIQALESRPSDFVGAAWVWSVGVAPPKLAGLARSGLEKVPEAAIQSASAFAKNARGADKMGDKLVDKLILVAVNVEGGRFLVQAREWDRELNLFGPIVARRAENELLPLCAVQTAVEAFSTVARLTNLEGNQAALSVRGGDLAGPEPLLKNGDALRLLRRRGEMTSRGKSIPIDWTWLVVDSMDGPRPKATLWSRWREPLSEPPDNVDDVFAVRVARSDAATTLRLTSIDQAPLAHLEVGTVDPPVTSFNPAGWTDAEGRITISPGETALRIIVVRHAGRAVGFLPMVPGLDYKLEASLDVDSAWLRALDAAAELRESLLEQVARRAIDSKRTHAQQAEGAAAQSESPAEEHRGLATADDFVRRIDAHRKRIVSRNADIQSRIDTLFDELAQSAKKYLEGPLPEALPADVLPAGPQPDAVGAP